MLYKEGMTPAFELANTDLPPKDLLFPQTEKMYRYGTDADGLPFIDASHDADDVILFGIRPCDMASIECMDDVFLSKSYIDEFYESRRSRLLTACIACSQPAPSCFCDSMGHSPASAPAADLMLWECEGGWLLSAQSDKGLAAAKAWAPFVRPMGGGQAADEEQPPTSPQPVAVSCALKVDMSGVRAKLEGMFEHPIWDALAKKCLTCGTCTYVCPTCHCFDISQANRMSTGERFRCWDSCMFSAYTEMAGGHNPRAEKRSRVRQRFMHKLCFFEQRYGKTLCVGCGRCVTACPVALDITSLIDEIGAADDAD
jgi:ferredoxin